MLRLIVETKENKVKDSCFRYNRKVEKDRRLLLQGLRNIAIASSAFSLLPTVIAFAERAPLTEAEKLKKFSDKRAPETNRMRAVVLEKPLFTGFKNLSIAQQLEDFDTYSLIYRGAQKKFFKDAHGEEVKEPLWVLLWLIHIHETTVSRDANTHNQQFTGAMQRSRSYSESLPPQAAKGYEFLSLLPQRFLKANGAQTSDYEEIFFAAAKLQKDAQQYLGGEPLEEALISALYHYSAPTHAKHREEYYRALKPLFAQPTRTKTA